MHPISKKRGAMPKDIFIFQWIAQDINGCVEVIGFGYDTTQRKVAVRVQDLPLYIYVETLNQSLLTTSPHVIKIELCNKHTLRTFLQPKKPLYKVYFSSLHKQEMFLAMIKKHIDASYIFHHTVSPVLLLANTTQINTCGWIQMDRAQKILTTRITTHHIVEEFITQAKFILPNKNHHIIPPLSVASMDIETFSHDLISFPNMYDPRDYIAFISVVYRDVLGCVTKYILYCSTKRLDNDALPDGCIGIGADNELQLIQNYFKLIADLAPDVVIGYNIYNFDNQYIFRRLCQDLNSYYGGGLIKPEYGGSITLSETQSKAKSQWGGKYFQMNCKGSINIDIYQYICKQMPSLPNKSLKFMAKKYLDNEKIDLSPTAMFQAIAKDTIPSLSTVAKYCIVDSELTIDLYDKFHVLIGMVEMANMCYMGMEEYATTGATAKYRNQLYYLCLSKDVVVDGIYQNLPESNKGGFVFDPIVGMFEWCTIIDFNSLYPSLIIAYNICYSTYAGDKEPEDYSNSKYYKINIDDKRSYYFVQPHIQQGFIPELCDTLLKTRSHIKQLMKTEKDPIKNIIYDHRQNITKITANSIYGCFSSGYTGVASFRQGAECITALGRQYLMATKDMVEKNYDVTVVYGDTDSCMIRFNSFPPQIEDKAEWCIQQAHIMCQQLSKNWREPMGIKYELLFRHVIFGAKKRYSGLDYKGNMYIKGIFRGTMCSYAKKIYTETMTNILNHNTKEQIKQYLTMVIDNISSVPIQEFSIRTRVKEAYNGNHALGVFKRNMEAEGKEITPNEMLELVYIKNDNSEAVGDKLVLLADIGDRILDYQYYIKTQILQSLHNELNIFDPVLYKELHAYNVQKTK